MSASNLTGRSFKSLLRRAGLVSGALQSRGVVRGDRVGLLCSNRAEWLEVCFGASATGDEEQRDRREPRET